jgi:hypothetical protein
MDISGEADDSWLADRAGTPNVGRQRLGQFGEIGLGHDRRCGSDVGQGLGCLVPPLGMEAGRS